MNILGISAYYHDSAAALITDGVIAAAAQEERYTRKKHDPGFPANAISYCLQSQNITIRDIDHIVFYDKPLLKFDRLLETYLSAAPKGFNSFRIMQHQLISRVHLMKQLCSVWTVLVSGPQHRCGMAKAVN